MFCKESEVKKSSELPGNIKENVNSLNFTGKLINLFLLCDIKDPSLNT